MCHQPRVRVLLALFLSSVLSPGVAAAQTLTSIDVPGARLTFATGINDRSQIVGTFYVGSSQHGYLRSNGQFTTIDVPGASATAVEGINNRMQMVGYYVTSEQGKNTSKGFLLDNGALTTINPPGAVSSIAESINDLGQIAGYYTDATGAYHGFVRTHNQYVSVDSPQTVGARHTFAQGINVAGQLVGQYWDANFGRHGFRLEPGGHFSTIDVPRAAGAGVYGINGRGEMVGAVSLGPFSVPGFLLAFGQFTTISGPGVVGTIARSINNRGQIVGYYGPIDESDDDVHGFLLTPANMVEDVSSQASPSGSRIPSVSVIWDGQLTMWTLGPGQEILHDGLQAAGGYGSQILWYRNAIYVLGDDNNWWRWTGSTWTYFEPTDPAIGR